MYPVLWQIPLPHWALPLSSLLLALAILGAFLVLLGWREKASLPTLIGLPVAVASLVAAVWFKGQILLPLAFIPVSSFGVLLWVAIALGWRLTLRLARKAGIARDLLANGLVLGVVSGFVGARLLYVVCNLSDYSSLADAMDTSRGGLAGYGGITTGLLLLCWYWGRCKVPVMVCLDIMTPSLALGITLTRLGSYLLGSDFGKPLGDGAAAWVQRLGCFPHWRADLFEGAGAPAWVHHVNLGLIPADSSASLPVHPLQLYEALSGMLLLVHCLIARKRTTVHGAAFLNLIFGYGALRWLLDALRDDPDRGQLGPCFAQHYLLPLGLCALAFTWVAGPSRSWSRPRLRRAAQSLSFVPALALYGFLRPTAFAKALAVQVTVSQWFGLLTACGAAMIHGVLLRRLPTSSTVPAPRRLDQLFQRVRRFSGRQSGG